jgi:hypothetical protein
MARRLALLACAAIALGGCAPTIATVPEAQASAVPTVQAPVIANLNIPTKHIIGAEQFEAHYDVTRAGSGLFASYGLKTRLGSQVFKIDHAIPVIDKGHVDMAAIGPLPNLTEGGELDAEFWVVDSAGQASNHLGFKMTVQ